MYFEFLRRLHLEQVHVAYQAAVLADLAVAGHEVVDRHLAHFRSDRRTIDGTGGSHRLQIMHDSAVSAGVDHGWDLPGLVDKTLRPCPGFVVEIPVERRTQDQSLRALQTETVDVGDEHQQTDQLLGLAHPEFAGLLDGVDEVTAGVG